ncbi:MAG: hypothetical protein WEB30_04860 [Cyclobacteriaceae bacterium]
MGVVRKVIFVIGFGWSVMLPVMGQEFTFGPVEKLSEDINSEGEECMPLLSPDGRTLYFSRLMYEQNVGGKYAGQDIWVSTFDGGKWSKADNRNPAINNNRKNNAVVGISSDGKTLYYLDVSPHEKLKGVYFSKNVMGNWSQPELILIDGVEHDGFLGLYVSEDREVILISMKGRDSKGEEDIYVSLKNPSGNWSVPRNIGPTINTSGFEISPFLSRDNKRLYFSSNGHQGLGNADIFYSDRLYESWETWSVPKNLGSAINSPSFDAFFSLYQDSLAFFVSTRDAGAADIYWSELVAISEPKLPLSNARQFVDDKEASEIVGSQPFIRFMSGSSELSLDQEEKIRRIAGHLSLRKDIQIVLVAMAGDGTSDLEVFKRRLNKILERLRLEGVEGSRVTFSIEEPDKAYTESPETVKIGLYR